MVEMDEDDTAELETGESLSDGQKKNLRQLVVKYCDVITGNLGRTKLVAHRIQLTDLTPCRQRPYRLLYSKYEAVKKELQSIEKMGIIKPSFSEWASPTCIVFVPQKRQRYSIVYRLPKVEQSFKI